MPHRDAHDSEHQTKELDGKSAVLPHRRTRKRDDIHAENPCFLAAVQEDRGSHHSNKNPHPMVSSFSTCARVGSVIGSRSMVAMTHRSDTLRTSVATRLRSCKQHAVVSSHCKSE
jgi:hypothetical protein